ncbi:MULTISPECIES: hypothetical protein [Capnocytophaga]|uniref:Restriction endonuclease n=1 Tax=Capnocytophaga endodontalis TaxID=2708117 RepID=A0A1Z4BQ98_9FLAO|nr:MULTISPECIES: hypothetical protein [Capnocytophaga]ASF43474.1 hypothetical protein CBG49_10545 [Capnocytophaga endodontalis]EPD99677.1 hypothetical protein HMPREF1528_01599 [Capnocytophaga sp. oral taxon 336 str. F0502]
MGYHLINLIDGKLEHCFKETYEELVYEDAITENTIIYQGEEKWRPFKISESEIYKALANEDFRIGIRAQHLFKKQADKEGFILEDLNQNQESFKIYTNNVDKPIKRGDYLVRNFGNIEIDVKCKTFYKFDRTPRETFFYFECDNLSKHLNMQSFTKTPILIAIYERNQKDKVQIKEDIIHFISIDEIERLKRILQKSIHSQYMIPTKYLHQGFNYIKEIFEKI